MNEKQNEIALAEALKVNTSIANIDLAFNGRKEGLKALYEASKVNTMVNINVSPYAEVPSDQKDSSCRGPFGVPVRIEVLAEALKVNSSIGSIDFTARGIRDAEALAKALKVSRSITKINLSRTYIGDEGTKAWWVIRSEAARHIMPSFCLTLRNSEALQLHIHQLHLT
eukprot:s2236_g10.t1